MAGARSHTFLTAFYNVFRGLLKFRAAEDFLAFLTGQRSRKALVWKLIPPEYLYQRPTQHRVTRGGIVYELDLSNHNDYYLFYGFLNPGLSYLFSLMKPHFTAIDIGANLGITTLNLARRCKKVYAYEPDSLNYDKLTRNISLNSYSNMVTSRKGLGNRKETRQLARVNKHHSGMNRVQSPVTRDFESESIRIETFDDEVRLLNIQEIDLMKIDVEGYELNVIRGAIDAIIKFKPLLFVELIESNLRQYGHSSETLVKLVRGIGYRIIDVKTGNNLVDADWESMETDILCIPYGNTDSSNTP